MRDVLGVLVSGAGSAWERAQSVRLRIPRAVDASPVAVYTTSSSGSASVTRRSMRTGMSSGRSRGQTRPAAYSVAALTRSARAGRTERAPTARRTASAEGRPPAATITAARKRRPPRWSSQEWTRVTRHRSGGRPSALGSSSAWASANGSRTISCTASHSSSARWMVRASFMIGSIPRGIAPLTPVTGFPVSPCITLREGYAHIPETSRSTLAPRHVRRPRRASAADAADRGPPPSRYRCGAERSRRSHRRHRGAQNVTRGPRHEKGPVLLRSARTSVRAPPTTRKSFVSPSTKEIRSMAVANQNVTLESSRRTAIAELLRRVAPVADELGARFAAAGHELALVGAPVRDALLRRPTKDIDLTTDAPPERTLEIIKGWADAYWTIGIEFGTVGLRKNGVEMEITTYRSESYDPKSRKPEVQYGTSLVEDLRRRDFAVNAMAARLPGHEFVDPFGGLTDLRDKVLRTPGRPEDSFADDPLRMLRAARFASQLGFTVAPDVVRAMTDMAARIEIVSAERIRDELSKLICGEHPRRGLALLVDTGLADHVLPELPKLRLEIDEHHRHKDVYEHSLIVLEQAIAQEEDGPDLVLRLAALLHDIGKPRTRRFEPGGRVSFHHHEVVGAKMARKRLTALRYPKDVVADVS